MDLFQKFQLKDGSFLAYKQHSTGNSKHSPGVIYCLGFAGNLEDKKPKHFHRYCENNGLDYIRFDYIGCRYSSGTLQDLSVGAWKQNTLDVLDNLTTGPQIFIASSLGAHVAQLVAIERPHRVHSIITIGNATDCLTNIMWLPGKKEVEEETFGFTVTEEMIEDAKHHCLLDSVIPINCPVRLLHGMKDDVIPYDTSVKVAENLSSEDVRVKLVKNADHLFHTEENLRLVCKEIDELLSTP